MTQEERAEEMEPEERQQERERMRTRWFNTSCATVWWVLASYNNSIFSRSNTQYIQTQPDVLTSC